jgi:hypothetical protein
MPIVWNDKARARLPARRREDVPAPVRGDKKTIWAAVRKSLAARPRYDPVEITFVRGRSLTTPALADLMEKCATIAASDEPPALDDVDVAAALAVLLTKHAYGRSLGLLLATLPVPRAFEAHLRSRDFAVQPSYVNLNDPFRLVGAPADADTVDAEWRRILLAQPDEIRAECKEVAGAAMAAGANLGKRTTIANAFFEETAWCDDVCRDWLARGVRRSAPLNDIVCDFDLATAIIRNRDSAWAYVPLVERFGERMLPVLVAMAGAPFDRYHARDVAEALALFDEPTAAAAMARLLQQSSSRPHALDYFTRHPERADDALAAVATMKGRAAKIAREVLAGAKRAAESAVAPDDEAAPGDLPLALARPPWLDEAKPRKPSTQLALERVDLPESVEWGPGELERARALFPRPAKPASEAALAEYAELRASGRFVDFVKHKGEALPDEVVLEAWNAGQKTYGGSLAQKVQHVFARFGDAALPGLPAFVEHLARGWGDAPFLLRVRSWRLALPFAEHVAHRRIGKLAWQWLQRHAEVAVLALVPAAFGRDKKAREHAERALFRLRASGVDVVAIGARYGAPAKAALDKLFTWDPLYDLPKTMPKLGPSWRPETLSRPRLASNGKALPLAALDTIATMLALSPVDPPYAGIAQVKEACEPRSLAELAWEAARAWEHAGHKKKDDWMLLSLVHFADDEVVRRLTPGIRPDFAVRVLEAIGSDAALMEMATIAGRTQSQGGEWTLGGRIEKLLGEAAAERGVTKDELEEDLAPTAALEEDGSLTLDYGPRKLEVGFDESLVPYVRSESGSRARALPPARKTDDPEKVERAKTVWRDLKEDVSVIASRRIRALERAMTSGRAWTFERFRRVWLEHRLMKHLARGVVWTDGATTFRVAEDGAPSNADDAPHALAANAKIGVAHPLRLPREELDKWRTVLEDYEIVQPFAQIDRRYVAVDPAATELAWPFAGASVGDLTTRLSRLGFQRGAYRQGIYSYRRDLPGKGQVRVELKHASPLAEDVRILFVDGEQQVAASELDAVALADAIHELGS